MKIDELGALLKIWQLKEAGGAVPQSYDQVVRQLGALRPDDNPVTLSGELRRQGWIEVLTNGDWTLTDSGVAARPPTGGETSAVQESPAAQEAAWRHFRTLCGYYADCVHLQEKEVEYLFDNQYGTRFYLPPLPIGWMQGNGKFRLSASTRQQVALDHVAYGAKEGQQAFIGYPLSAFTGATGRCYAPLLLFPVDITQDAAGTWAEIQKDDIDINQKWLRNNLPPDEYQTVLKSLTFTDKGRKGMVNPEAAIGYFAHRSRTALEPDRLVFGLGDGVGILNAAALFLENGLKYSKSLKRELRRIQAEPASVLDQTALAYVFREPRLPNHYNGQEDVAYDFIAANSEQHEAVDEALNHPASKVTGPPGTGKSQVAVNIIANQLVRGRSLLFTSKNHKAVHAIHDKVGALEEDFPLIQFCSQSDGGPGTAWFSQDLDTQIGRVVRAREALRGAGAGAVETLEYASDQWRDRKHYIRAVEAIRKGVTTATRRRAEYGKRLKDLGVSPRKGLAQELEAIRSAWRKPNAECLPWWQRLLVSLFRKSKQEPELDVRIVLNKVLPGLCDEYTSDEVLKRRVNQVAEDLAGYDQEEARLQELAARETELPPYDKMLETLGKAYQDIQRVQRTALVEKLAAQAQNTSDTTLQQLRDAVSFLNRANLPFMADLIAPDQNAVAQEAFRNYAKIFPAWACTLLSLHKAAPCIAGLFDRVIIDEASQCEIPPIIPALYRARGVTVIGDPNQFPPVITLREARNAQLRMVRYGLDRMEDERFDFCSGTAYSVMPVRPVELREHFRCHADIVDYCNDVFYQDHLRCRTNEEQLVFPSAQGFHAGRVWRNVTDSLEGEYMEAEKVLSEMAEADFKGSVGVVTPFRDVANELQTRLRRFEGQFAHFSVKDDVSTANGFQGGERDVMVFVLGYTSKLRTGLTWYTTSNENRYIFNVAVSRARACLIVVGDRGRAAASGFAPLARLTHEPRPRPKRFDSPPEKQLHDALVAAGFAPESQYPLAGRFLDLALPDARIDIEIDGEAYHLGATGERQQGDVFRDIVVQGAGWHVLRFWARRVIGDVAGCVADIQKKYDDVIGD